MVMTYQPPFPQTPRASNVALNSLNTAIDGTGTITTIVTAGQNGALVTHCHIVSQATSVATVVRLFMSDGVFWVYMTSVAVPAFTVATTTAQTPILFADRNNPDSAIRIPAGWKLGVTEGVTTPLRVYTEWMDL